MKKMNFISLLAVTVICAVAFSSCNKEPVSLLDGTYSGYLTSVVADTPVISEPSDYPITLTLNQGKYTYDDGIPCNYGNGTFSTKRGEIRFNQTSGPVVKLALYLWWDLDGEYEYTFNGEKLTITRTYDTDSEMFVFVKSPKLVHFN
ncbi:MAG: hypothetical protein LBV18_07180 [Alistipes sp.]|jgi:hypothetical protein|nr:hypothetical protein [Alistipes sp.]